MENEEVKEKTEEEYKKREKKLEDKIKNLLKNPYSASLLGVILLALIIRIYYFYLTKDQTLWWDSLCYGSIAKNLLTHAWDTTQIIIGETNIRPWGMPIAWAFLMKLGISELGSKFILEFIPSVLTVFFTYLVVEKMYNKRVALIASFILSVSWIHIFYSMRMLTRIPGLFLSMVSVYYFFKALEKEKINFKHFAVAIFLAFLAVLVRWTFALAGVVYISYLMLLEGLFAYFLVALVVAAILKLVLGLSLSITLLFFVLIIGAGIGINRKKLKIFNKKQFWISSLVGSIPMIIFFVFNFIKYGSLFPALTNYAVSAGRKTDFYWQALGFFRHVLGGSLWGFPSVLFILFIIGIVVMVYQLAIGYGLISKVKKLRSHLFVILLLVLNIGFLIFYIKYSEDRYLFECFLSILLITAYALDLLYVSIKKYHKQAALIVVIVILFLGAYNQYVYGNPIIESRATSYYQMQPAFLWLKDNVPQDAVILGAGIQPYAIYYAERTPLQLAEFSENKSRKFDYVVIHGFSEQPQEYKDYLESIQNNLTMVHIEYFDPENPAVIIYKYG